MTKPNFFIVGAPKCGTTALSEYLRGHPMIFLCDPKEPRYFSEDLDQNRYVRTLADYLELFRHAEPQHTVIGEASVDYLYSSVALANIRAFDPDAKIVAIVRNPIDMAASLHRQLLFARYEDEPDFERAWHLQASRRQGRNIPKACRAPQYLQYAEACRLGFQVQRLLATFPPAQVKVLVFDDLIVDTAEVYRDVLQFLGLPDDGRTSFERINEAKQARWNWAAGLIARGKPWAVSLALKFRTATGLNPLPLMKRATAFNETRAVKKQFSGKFRKELVTAFQADIQLLSRLLERDLSHWFSSDD
jgi:hypothetical protein